MLADEGTDFKSITFKSCNDFRDASARELTVFYGLTQPVST